MDVMTRVPVREQDPQVRAANFEEVCLGYNAEEAMAEAARCLNCKNAQCIREGGQFQCGRLSVIEREEGISAVCTDAVLV